ncbi:MAG: zinc-dependent metalloprotease [Acidobacteria bacterium]|nr:zinc-dependent metalloprotease [Acidobacteriota bacterium]MBS1865208.1 zinc-dependent metalloprotease [Acidobacteriota bacterium]
MKGAILAVLSFILYAAPAELRAQAAPSAPQAIAEKTKDAQKLAGYFNLYWEAKQGKLWLEIDKWGSDFLYQSSLPAGIGSNDIGLDRGQLGATRIVRFERSGPKVLLVQQNLDYRAISSDPYEQKAVHDSFAESVIWGFSSAAEEGERVLVDATDFFLRDAHGVAGALRRTKQGNFHLENSRSAIYLANTKNFPLNTEVEATLTFVGDDPGEWVRHVTPDPQAITVREHHSFVQLPPAGYRTRVYDPRASYFGISYFDYATPVSEHINKRFISRHRLEKKDPSAAMSEPVTPIVYYLDRGAPEPIRSALLDGARWWNQAFEAAGYKNAFRVELLPEGADPMDLRYNVIQWVHRATRGWSYGAGVIDPRTGEIIKGHVTLGSLRVRQDYLIAEGLLAPYEKGKPVSPKMLEMALARLRQLAAHEVGHTLGLEHNYSASTVGRSSVMDYPPSYVKLGADGVPDISEAYATGIGEWDKVAIAWGYQDFPKGTDEPAALNKILNDAFAHGLRFLTDQDARPAGSSSSLAHLWDTGANAVDELNRLMTVRAAALKRFGENNIREGEPLATMEDALVPIYMLHRYQVEAASKLVGGMDYVFALRGDGQVPTKIVAPAEQRRALHAVLDTVKPEALMLPEKLLEMIPPRPPDYERGREQFKIRTSPAFDALAPSEAAAQHTLQFLFNPERAARLVEFHARDAANPGLEEVIDAVLTATWKAPRGADYKGAVARVVDDVALYDLLTLATNDAASNESKAIAAYKLRQLKTWLSGAATGAGEDELAHRAQAVRQIEQFERDPKKLELPRPSLPPDGPPIGGSVGNMDDGEPFFPGIS